MENHSHGELECFKHIRTRANRAKVKNSNMDQTIVSRNRTLSPQKKEVFIHQIKQIYLPKI